MLASRARSGSDRRRTCFCSASLNEVIRGAAERADLNIEKSSVSAAKVRVVAGEGRWPRRSGRAGGGAGSGGGRERLSVGHERVGELVLGAGHLLLMVCPSLAVMPLGVLRTVTVSL
jgi:hypothetical protein